MGSGDEVIAQYKILERELKLEQLDNFIESVNCQVARVCSNGLSTSGDSLGVEERMRESRWDFFFLRFFNPNLDLEHGVVRPNRASPCLSCLILLLPTASS